MTAIRAKMDLNWCFNLKEIAFQEKQIFLKIWVKIAKKIANL